MACKIYSIKDIKHINKLIDERNDKIQIIFNSYNNCMVCTSQKIVPYNDKPHQGSGGLIPIDIKITKLYFYLSKKSIQCKNLIFKLMF